MEKRRKRKIRIIQSVILALLICIGISAGAEAAGRKTALSQMDMTLYIGQSRTLKVQNAKAQVRWSSSRKNIATVSSRGKITAKKQGKTTITAKIGKKKYKCKVTVKKPELSQSILYLNVNEAQRLSARGTKEKITWEAKNPQVIRVSKRGNVRGLQAGKTWVIAMAGERRLRCRVIVEDPVLSSHSVILSEGAAYHLSVQGTERMAQWSSTDPAVAYVSENGLVTAVGRGTAVVMAKVGTKTESCSITVMGSRNTFKSISHRGYAPGTSSGNCLLSSYANARSHGFNYVETDIQFTKDGEPVCCHDKTFTDGATGEVVEIAAHTLTELKAYNYHGETIASLEELTAFCSASGMGIYIDKTTNIAKTRERVTRVFEILEKYRMTERVTFLITTENQAKKILERNRKASLSVLMSAARNLQFCAALANKVKTPENKVSIDCSYYRVTVEELLACRSILSPGITFEACTVNSAAAYRKFLPYVEGITSDKWCLNDFL